MITEDYVSFELAKLLKEKGFDESCTHVYNIENERNMEADFYTCKYVYNSWLDKNEPRLIVAPTLQMTMKWLRKVHKLEIYPFHDMLQGSAWWYRIERNTGLSLIVEKEEDAIYGTYEEACETAIKYCLENLI